MQFYATEFNPNGQLPRSLRKLSYKHDRQGHRHNRVRSVRRLPGHRARGRHEPLAFLLALKPPRGWTLGQLSSGGIGMYGFKT
jgi:hypothetical protein